jgi:chaperonin GroES
MNLKPLTDHLIIKKITKDKTESGIVLPSEAQEKGRAEVVAVGPGRVLDSGKLLEVSVKKGDEIIYREYAGDKVKEGGQEYWVISETDVIAVVEK